MGTETKINCYTENSTTGVIRNPQIIKNNSDSIQGNCSNGKITSTKSSAQNAEPFPKAIVPFVPIHIDENNVIEGAKEILRAIRPHWDLNSVHFKKFTDGITNKLVGCFYTETTNSDDITALTNGIHNSCIHNSNGHAHEEFVQNGSAHHRSAALELDNNDSGNLSDADDTDSETSTSTDLTGSPNNVVLVRVYGNKTDLLIDRKAETRNIILLHSYGFAPSLFATFKNGLAYDFVPGVTLNTESVLRVEVWSLVARRMAEMHRVVNAREGVGAQRTTAEPVPMLWRKTQSFFDLVPERFADAGKHKRLEGTFLPISRMRAEFDELYAHLETLGSPVVFAHNDLLLGNVVYTESQQTVSFIDYEYADYNFQAFDIGNHFAEFAGVDTVDYARYPCRQFQLEWLRVYLQAYLQRSHVSDAEVERLYVQVNKFALAAHLFWTIWSLIQAEHSTIDFDYVDYAFMRYNEYLARKEEFLALDANMRN